MKKFSLHTLLVCLLLWSCDREINLEELQPLPTEPNVVLNFQVPESPNGRVLYDIDHIELTVRDINEPSHIQTYTSLQADQSSTTLALPPCDDFEMLQMNVYNSDNEIILVQDPSMVGRRVISSCSGDDDLPIIELPDKDPIILRQRVKGVGFDWESDDVIHVSNDPSLPLLPWISSASTSVPRAAALDHKKEDGWELMHNSFTLENNSIDPRKYLLFYNKYTGVLRMWYWSGQVDQSSQMNYFIQHLANSSLLNFNADFASPMDVRNPRYSEFASGEAAIPSSQGLTDDTWYMFEYELAYDNNVGNLTQEQSDFILGARAINISSINISGTQEGSISGDIMFSAPSSMFSLGSIKVDKSRVSTDNSNQTNMTFNTGLNSGDEASNWWQKLGGKVKDGISSAVGKSSGELAGNVLSLVTDPLGKFLNSLIKQEKNSGPTVKLKMATQIDLEGTITNEVPITSVNLHIPGSQNNTLDYLYDQPIGAFNINTAPKVKYAQTYYHIARWGTPRYYQYFSLDRNSFEFVINPAIANDITILEESSELLFYKRYAGGMTLQKLTGFGCASLPNNTLAFSTDLNLPSGQAYNCPDHREGYEYYTIKEGITIPPVATSESFGVWWDEIPAPNYLEYLPKMQPDGRVVVRTHLKYRINATGKEIDVVKTYLPEFIEDQSGMNLEY